MKDRAQIELDALRLKDKGRNAASSDAGQGESEPSLSSRASQDPPSTEGSAGGRAVGSYGPGEVRAILETLDKRGAVTRKDPSAALKAAADKANRKSGGRVPSMRQPLTAGTLSKGLSQQKGYSMDDPDDPSQGRL